MELNSLGLKHGISIGFYIFSTAICLRYSRTKSGERRRVTRYIALNIVTNHTTQILSQDIVVTPLMFRTRWQGRWLTPGFQYWTNNRYGVIMKGGGGGVLVYWLQNGNMNQKECYQLIWTDYNTAICCCNQVLNTGYSTPEAVSTNLFKKKRQQVRYFPHINTPPI